MNIEKNHVVTMHYTVSTSDGTEIDSSLDGEPLVFIQGMGFLIPGLEKELEGKQVGDKFNADIPAKDAYGERLDDLVQEVPKNMFEGMEVEVGLQFRATTDDGEQSVIVIDVNDEFVVVDGNHPLAGTDLSFAVEVIDIRPASEEELAEGHAQVTAEVENEDDCCAKGTCGN